MSMADIHVMVYSRSRDKTYETKQATRTGWDAQRKSKMSVHKTHLSSALIIQISTRDGRLKGKQLLQYLLQWLVVGLFALQTEGENDDVTWFTAVVSYVIKSVVDVVDAVTATKDAAVFFRWPIDRARSSRR